MFLAALLDFSFFRYYFGYGYNWFYALFPDFMERFIELLIAPLVYREMLWIILPMAFTILVMELYFGVYVSEELGWNSAVANSVFLIFVAIDLFRQILWTSPVLGSMRITLLIIAGAVVVQGLGMLILNFFHVLPRKVAFQVSSALPVNLYAYIAIILVYTNLPHVYNSIPIDQLTAVAGVALFLGMFVVFGLVHMLEPHSYEE